MIQKSVKMENQFRPSNRLDLMSEAEKAIMEAMRKVEEAGASEKLTKAVMQLDEARYLVYEHYKKEFEKEGK